MESFDLALRQKVGKKGGMIMMFYMSAFMLPKGRSLLEMLGGSATSLDGRSGS